MNKYESSKIIQYRCDSETFFKIGIKYVDKKMYHKALRFLNRATEMEPFNADYQYNLAGVFAELKEPEKSNNILMGILTNIDPTFTECYFGVGCNYFDLEDFKKSKEYFEKYLYFNPEGSFADEVYNVLYYLQIYDDMGDNIKRNRKLVKLIDEGEKLFDKGDYKKACSKLEKAIETNPEMVSPRNKLSLVYFFTGEVSKAISLAKSALKLDSKNMYAHCNLAIFYSHSNEQNLLKKQIKVLSNLRMTDIQEFSQLLDTYLRLDRYGEIANITKKFAGDKQKAKVVLLNLLNSRNTRDDLKEAVTKAIGLIESSK